MILSLSMLIGLSLTSCWKDYYCTYENIGISGNWEIHEDLSRSDAKDYNRVCQDIGGNWLEAD